MIVQINFQTSSTLCDNAEEIISDVLSLNSVDLFYHNQYLCSFIREISRSTTSNVFLCIYFKTAGNILKGTRFFVMTDEVARAAILLIKFLTEIEILIGINDFS